MADAQTPTDILARYTLHRSSEDGEMACGHRIGGKDAEQMVVALHDAGFVIVTAAMLSDLSMKAEQKR